MDFTLSHPLSPSLCSDPNTYAYIEPPGTTPGRFSAVRHGSPISRVCSDLFVVDHDLFVDDEAESSPRLACGSPVITSSSGSLPPLSTAMIGGGVGWFHFIGPDVERSSPGVCVCVPVRGMAAFFVA